MCSLIHVNTECIVTCGAMDLNSEQYQHYLLSLYCLYSLRVRSMREINFCVCSNVFHAITFYQGDKRGGQIFYVSDRTNWAQVETINIFGISIKK